MRSFVPLLNKFWFAAEAAPWQGGRLTRRMHVVIFWSLTAMGAEVRQMAAEVESVERATVEARGTSVAEAHAQLSVSRAFWRCHPQRCLGICRVFLLCALNYPRN